MQNNLGLEGSAPIYHYLFCNSKVYMNLKRILSRIEYSLTSPKYVPVITTYNYAFQRLNGLNWMQ